MFFYSLSLQVFKKWVTSIIAADYSEILQLFFVELLAEERLAVLNDICALVAKLKTSWYNKFLFYKLRLFVKMIKNTWSS